MSPQEYADLILDAVDKVYDAIRDALPEDVEMEKRFLAASENVESSWLAELVNKDSGKIRILILNIQNLSSANAEATAGGKQFKPSVRLVLELIHDYSSEDETVNTQLVFNTDALKTQFAVEANKNLPPKGYIGNNFQLNLGIASSGNRSVFYGRGDIVIEFREIRYDING